MIHEPAVSIIVPIYNIPNEFLKQSLYSLVNQSMQSLEIIVVDDGSPMVGNAELCDEFARQYSVLRVIHKKNEGVSVARNAGMAEATGKWLAFVDPDDWIDETMIERLCQGVTSEDTDIVVCNCWVESEHKTESNAFFDPANDSFRWNADMKEQTLLQIMGRNRFYYPPHIAIGVPWGKLYRRLFIENVKLVFQQELHRMQDNIFNLYAFQEAKSVSYVPEYLYHYRKFSESTSNRFSPKVINDFEKIFEHSRRFLDTYPHDSKLQQAYYSRIIQSFHSFFRFYFFNPGNAETYKQKKAEITALLKREPYREAITQIKLSQASRSIALFLILLRLRCYRLLGWLISQRQR
jgi:glycosyltransferase involved in cell wall biosynthesis